MGQKCKDQIGHIQKNIALAVEEESCLSRMTDRRLREAKFPRAQSGGAERHRKMRVEKGDNTENWKGTRGFLDGNKKTEGKSGIEGVDKSITIGIIAVQMTSCTAMAAEIVGASVSSGILDLHLFCPRSAGET